MIVITGACGFIGSCLLSFLNYKGYSDILIVDDFSNQKKMINLEGKIYSMKIDRSTFLDWFRINKRLIKEVYHLGARTDTLEMKDNIFIDLNLNYSKEIWKVCATENIPFIYASSAATYGNGEFGYDDSYATLKKLNPLNPYAIFKHEFDKWVLKQNQSPGFWCGLKFFNVYGPNEYHKGKMSSVIMHAYNNIIKTKKIYLFRSYNELYKDGEQKRDFIYVKDVINIIYFMMTQRVPSDIYNIGTGISNTFLDLSFNIFKSMNKKERVLFVDMPILLRDKYQYCTQANINKLRSIGYDKEFYNLKQGIDDYIVNYLNKNNYL